MDTSLDHGADFDSSMRNLRAPEVALKVTRTGLRHWFDTGVRCFIIRLISRYFLRTLLNAPLLYFSTESDGSRILVNTRNLPVMQTWASKNLEEFYTQLYIRLDWQMERHRGRKHTCTSLVISTMIRNLVSYNDADTFSRRTINNYF